MSFFIGLTPGGIGVSIKDTVTYRGKSVSCASNRQPIFSVPFVFGYLAHKGRLQFKVDLGANIIPLKKTNDYLEVRDFGYIKAFLGYAITQRLIISGGVGMTVISITSKAKFPDFDLMNNRDDKTSKQFKNLWSPFLGAEIQYQLRPSLHGILGIQIGATMPQKDQGALSSMKEITAPSADGSPIKYPAGTILGENLPLSHSAVVGRVTIGVLYEIGGSK